MTTWMKVMFGLLILAMLSLIPALFGLGQAASAIRMRGDRMVSRVPVAVVLATAGAAAAALLEMQVRSSRAAKLVSGLLARRRSGRRTRRPRW